MQTYRVLAHWDDNAKVWWAESDEVSGLGVRHLNSWTETCGKLRLFSLVGGNALGRHDRRSRRER
jgi:hypothetical protein